VGAAVGAWDGEVVGALVGDLVGATGWWKKSHGKEASIRTATGGGTQWSLCSINGSV